MAIRSEFSRLTTGSEAITLNAATLAAVNREHGSVTSTITKGYGSVSADPTATRGVNSQRDPAIFRLSNNYHLSIRSKRHRKRRFFKRLIKAKKKIKKIMIRKK